MSFSVSEEEGEPARPRVGLFVHREKQHFFLDVYKIIRTFIFLVKFSHFAAPTY